MEIKTKNGFVEYENIEDVDLGKYKPIQSTVSQDYQLNYLIDREEIFKTHPLISKLPNRNLKNFNNVNIKFDSVLLNMVGVKTYIYGEKLRNKINRKFEFFEPDNYVDSISSPFTLEDGTIFRVVGQGIKPIQQYDFNIIEDGIVKSIPNFETVQVLLSERGRLVEEIRVIEEREFKDLLRESDKNRLIDMGVPSDKAERAANEISLGVEPSINLPSGFSPQSSGTAKGADSENADGSSGGASSPGSGGVGGDGGGPGSSSTGTGSDSSVGDGGASGGAEGDSGAGGDGFGGGDQSFGGDIGYEDRSDEYDPNMDSLTFSEAFLEMSETAGSQCQTLSTFQSNVDQQVEVLNNEIESKTAEADAAKSEADAARQESESAQARANADMVNARAREAEAELELENARLKRMEYEFLISRES